MWETGYLLDLTEFPEEEPLLERMAPYLDEARRKRLADVKNRKVFLQSFGAGLLLQKALQDYKKGVPYNCRKNGKEAWLQHLFTGEKLLEELEANEPLPVELTFGEQGKPYLTNYPLYFSLSHSKDMCLCVLSETEIGADIQAHTGSNMERVSKRIFTEKELEEIKPFSDESEKKKYFFTKWCEKEAYGKYTGQGVMRLLWQDNEKLPAEEKDLKWEIYTISVADNDYSIAVCGKQEK